MILTDANQTAKGVFTAAPFLMAGKVPGESTLAVAAQNNSAILQAFGAPTPTEAIASMPGAVAVNAQDLMQRGELTMRGLAYTTTAYNMKSIGGTTSWTATAGFFQSGGLYSPPSSVTAAEASSAYTADGQLGYLLSVSGAPASTAEFSLEFIYHLEGVPQPSSGMVMTSTPSPAGTTTTVERVLAAMNTAGEYFAMGTSVADKLGRLGTQMYRFTNQPRLLLR